MSPSSGPGDLPQRRFFLGLTVLLGFYLGAEALYISRLPLVMDEIHGASHVLRLASEVPYRDFQPYKTVLGSYVQLPALLAGAPTWGALLLVKLEMALLSAGVLLWASLRLGRIFRRQAVLAALLLLVVMSTFLERSAALRLDTMTALAGLVSLVLLLERRWVAAGLALGVSFLISQKAAYYVVASAAAFTLAWALGRRRSSGEGSARGLVGGGLAFFGAAAVPPALYLGLFVLLAGVEAVFGATFLAHGEIAFGEIYDIRGQFWWQTLRRNPVFYALALAALGRLAWAPQAASPEEGAGRARRHQLLAYGAFLWALCLWHRQPWPYFFVLLLPTLFVIQAAGFDAVLRGMRRPLRLAKAPLATALLAVILLGGVVYPLSRVPLVLTRDQGFQRHMFDLADRFLGPEETYVAGLNFLYHRRQTVAALGWLDRRRSDQFLAAPPEALEALVGELQGAPLKLVIVNYRLTQLPPPVEAYLQRNYAQLWGNLDIYAPWIDPREAIFELRFAGRYLVLPEADGTVVVDGQALERAQVVTLASGRHDNLSAVPFRLKLIPPGLEQQVDPRYRDRRSLFPEVYSF